MTVVIEIGTIEMIHKIETGMHGQDMDRDIDNDIDSFIHSHVSMYNLVRSEHSRSYHSLHRNINHVVLFFSSTTYTPLND